MSADTYYDRISRYFEGKMNDEERSLLEADLNRDPLLKEAYEKYELALASLDILSEEKLKAEFHQWRKKENKKAKIFTLSTMLRSLAAVALLLVLSWVAYQWIDPSSPKDLFESFGQPMQGEMVRSGQDDLFANAMDAYQKGHFGKAIAVFNTMDDIDDRALFYLGHSYYLAEKYPEAEVKFREILAMDESVFSEEAAWGLLASLYYQNKKGDEFDALIKKIAQSDHHSFQQEAQEMIHYLENQK